MKAAMPESLTLLKRLATINRTITTSLDFERALGLIAESGLELVGATACFVVLRDPAEVLRVVAARGVDPAIAARFLGSMEESVLEELRQFFGLDRPKSVSAFPVISDNT